MMAIKLRSFAWRYFVFLCSNFVISTFRVALFRLFVFSRGVISSFRLFARRYFVFSSFRVALFRCEITKRRNGTNKPPYFCFWEEIVLKVFAIYSYGGHLSHVTWVIYANFRSPFLRMLRKQFNFGLSFGFRGEYHGNC